LSNNPANSTIRYPVTVRPVKEVSLTGTADLAYWKARLEPEGLFPYDDQGRARLVLIGAGMKWMGVRFTELSVSVALSSDPAGDRPVGMYLAQAFNSVGWFAWVERTLFQTPYDPGQTELEARPPVCLALRVGQAQVLRAAMATPSPVAWRGDEVWEGGIFLPGRVTRTPRAEKLFFGRLSGDTEVYAFSLQTDTLELKPSPAANVVQWLLESGFAGQEWHIRRAATHQKSQTYARASRAAQAGLALPGSFTTPRAVTRERSGASGGYGQK
jgi:hypothetical protein